MVRKDVHTEHCCKKHGCKYSDSKCTVTTGKKPQSQQCETCEFEEESNRYELAELKSTVKTAEKTIDSLLPKGVKRIGPVELSLAFEPEAGWSASFAYKLTRRLNGTRFTVSSLSLSAEDAVTALVDKVTLTAKNTGKRVETLW